MWKKKETLESAYQFENIFFKFHSKILDWYRPQPMPAWQYHNYLYVQEKVQ